MNSVTSSQRQVPSQILEVQREGTTVEIDLDSGDGFTVRETEDAGRHYLVLEVYAGQGEEEEAEAERRGPSRRVVFDRVALAHENGSQVHLTMRVSFTPGAP
jgi:hypothetical protein